VTEAKSLARTIARTAEAPRVFNMNTAAFEATKYGAAALERECREIADAKPGERNVKLNSSAFSVAQLVAGGEIPQSEAEREILRAARACGIKDREAIATITSAFKGGMKEPRSAPPRAERMPPSENDSGPPVDDYQHTDDDAPSTPPADSAQQERPKSRIEIVESEALFAPLEEPDWLIDGVIRRGSLVELVGYGSSGKSWIAIDALLSVAAGVPWLGRFAAKQGSALGLDWENGLYEARRRIQAVAKSRRLWAVPGLSIAPMPSIYMSDPKFGHVIEKLADGRGLVVVDTLKAATPGSDENDSSMRGGLDALRRVGEKTGCSFLVLVHAKKTSGALTAINAREAGRGSSAIFDAADSVLHMTYIEGEPLRVQQTKSRQGRQIEPFQVTIDDGADGAVFVVAKDVPSTEVVSNSDKFEAACQRVLDAIREWPGSSKSTLREKLGMRNGTVGAALDRLQRDGAARNTGSKSEPKWFPTSLGGSNND